VSDQDETSTRVYISRQRDRPRLEQCPGLPYDLTNCTALIDTAHVTLCGACYRRQAKRDGGTADLSP
jgi:hypothetical protein